jgi:hypothetical protein
MSTSRRKSQEQLNDEGAPGWGATIPYQDPATGRVTIREETPAEPIDVPLEADAHWVFAGYPIDPDMVWRGEGKRCVAMFPNSRFERSARCELIAHGPKIRHYLRG